MSGIKQHIKNTLAFSAREQTAIIAIIVLLVLALVFSLFPNLVTGSARSIDYSRFDASIRAYYTEIRIRDSLESLQSSFDFMQPDKSAAEQKLQPFPFNPNGLPEEQWRKLGMADHQIRMIKNFEQKGGRFYRKEDLRRIYAISDAEYQLLEPYIVIPAAERSISARAEEPPVPTEEVDPFEGLSVDVNTAGIDELVQLPQIGQWFAERIIRYRDALGGFRQLDQLLEVQRMDTMRLAIIRPYITFDTAVIVKKKVNNDDFKSLLSHPYISFELTRLIVNQRERRGQLSSWEQMNGLPGADTLVQPKLRFYLDFD